MEVRKIESQIYALEKMLNEGKCKNKYAVQNKIRNLRTSLQEKQKQKAWEDYLSK